VDDYGYIIVDSQQRTNIPGVYAAGDVTTNPVKQIGTAVGQAIVAATDAFGYIRRPYYYKA
jgi:thioredoxin reductase (NADPH)